MSKILSASLALIGATIGAGILGIPYVISKSGFALGLVNLIIIASIIILINLYLGEIGLRTKANHQLTGYAEKYLGKKGKILMLIAFSFGIYSALLAYLIGEGESLSFLFLGTVQYKLYFGILFWLVISAITYFGLKAFEESEKIGVTLMIIFIIAIILFYSNKIASSNLTYNNPKNFFMPFGVILFAFLGFAAIPKVEQILNKNKKLTKKTIIISYLACLIIYIAFTAIVLGVNGNKTPQIATLSLGKPFILFSIITMFTASLAVLTAIIDTIKLDFKKSKLKAWFYAVSPPILLLLILNFFEIAVFTRILGIGGVISGGVTSILILLMAKRAKQFGERKPEYSIPYSVIISSAIIILLLIAIALEIKSSL
ncbi:MAG: aromatic amino acid transport family protein [Nanoarchaeota archaeon]